MKKTKVELNLQQFTTIKKLFNCASDDVKRGSLTYVFYNSKEKELVATNGIILRLEKTDLGENDLLFYKKDFDISQKEMKKIFYNKEAIHTTEITISENDYPNYQVCIPSFKNNKFENGFLVSINIDEMIKIQKSLDENERILLFVTTHSQISPIKIYSLINENYYKFVGVIMPLDINRTNLLQKLKENENNLY